MRRFLHHRTCNCSRPTPPKVSIPCPRVGRGWEFFGGRLSNESSHEKASAPAGEASVPKCQDAALEPPAPQTPSSVPFQAPELHPMSKAPSPQGCSLPPLMRMGSHLASPRPSQLLKRSERTPPSSSNAAPNHAKLISSLSALGDKFFALHGVALQSYMEIMPSYEAASGSSSRGSQLEGELKALRKEKAREEGVLECRLKNLASEHTTLQERYGASVWRTVAVRATLEGVQAERDSAMRERDVAVKERDSLRACKDERLQTYDRLLD
ncbi:hypothetical protein LIER_17526 [Lithospermum erythrorhizon]|uniref:Uncharacterized protein n=1 Tax=Lithospermum erythrorhizon TaxID=34254 RepID=A0AAV3QBK9_LITER